MTRYRRSSSERGEVAALVVFFPLFIVCVFAMVQAIQWRHQRQVAVAVAQETAAAVALYQADPAASTADATASLARAGLTRVQVTVTGPPDAAVVQVSATAPGILVGTRTTVKVSATAPKEQWTP